MAIGNYISTGKCIWCGRAIVNGATFHNIPHVFPHALGGEDTCTDVCDDCNHYFGTTKVHGVPSIDLTFKEIFNAYRFFCQNLNENSYKKLRSTFFSYHHNTHSIKIRQNFRNDILCRQLKRGLYECFLQKYHQVTGDGNNQIFDSVRQYARYNYGDLRVYYAFNEIILAEKEQDRPHLGMSDKLLDDMREYGVYHFWLLGHSFYLEVLPITFNVKGMAYLQNEAKHILLPTSDRVGIFEFNDIRQIDPLMFRFNNR